MNTIKWIKMSLEDAIGFDMVITEAIKKALPNLALEIGEDIRKYLIYTIIGNFNYTRIGIFDLEHHNRYKESADAENVMWGDIISQQGWEVVDSLPVEEPEEV